MGREYPPLPPGYDRALSISQLEKAGQCPERWRQIYLEGRREPETEATKLGSEVHGHMEDLVLKGTFPPNTRAGKLAQELITILPYQLDREDVEYTVEGHFYLPLPGGQLMQGFVDLTCDTLTGTEHRLVVDYKTTSNLKYKKDLSKDPQAALYTEALDADELGWLYVQTKGSPTPTPVLHTPDRKKTKLIVLGLDERATEVGRWYSEKPEQLPGDLKRCRDFGTLCPAASRCHTYQKANGGLKVMTQGFKERLAALRAQQQNGTAALKKADGAPSAEIQKELESESTIMSPAAAAVRAEVERVEAEEKLVADLKARGDKAKAEADKKFPAEPEAKEEEKPAAEEKPKRKRRTKAEIEAAFSGLALTPHAVEKIQEAEAAVTTGDVIQGVKEDGSVEDLVVTDSGVARFATIYLNCRPDVGAEPVEKYYQQANDTVRFATGVSHYTNIDFGKGRALFSEALEGVLADAGFPDLVVSTSNPDYAAAATTLATAGYRFVRGFGA
jgi:hypothetical protein